MPSTIDRLLPVWLDSQGVACRLGPSPSESTITLAFDENGLVISSWGEQCGRQPTIAEIAAFEESPEWLAHVKSVKIATLKPQKESHWSAAWDESAMRNALCNIPTGATGQMTTDRATLETYWSDLVGDINTAKIPSVVDAITPEWPTLVGVQNV